MNSRVQLEVRNSDCFECKLGDQASGLDKCVTAQGNDQADLLIVTAKPLGRKQRDELDKFLELGGINLESVAYTAVNKCSVWDAKPGKADIRTCASMYLEPEIALIKPKVILALGNEALGATVGRSGIMKYRGQAMVHKATGIPVFPTISPAMVARNPGQYDGFVADLRFVHGMITGAELSDELKPKAFRYIMSKKGLKLLSERLNVCEGYAFDIETNGFDEFKPDSKIITLSLTTWMPGELPSEVWVIPLYHPESPFQDIWRRLLQWLRPFLKKPKKKIAHNGKFDLRWMRQFGIPLSLTFDTMLAAHLLDENRPKGLKPLARTILGVAPWEMDTKALLDEPLKKIMKYNGLDTWYTAHLYFHFRKQLLERPRLMKIMKYIMVPASNAFTEIEMKGIWVDTEKLSTNSKIAKETLDDINAQLMKHVPPREVWPDNVKEVNFNASNFARWWLFDYLKLPVLGRGKDKEDGSPGAPSMAEGHMQRLAKDYPHPAIDLLLERVKWQKFHSSFFTAYQEQIDERDRIHTTFKLTGTVTGRLSSGKGDEEKVTGRVQNRGVNLQQVPRDKFVKGIFGGPPGNVFLECDYSQVELRIAAFIAREDNMMHLYQTNQDIHMATAMKMTNKMGRPDLVTKEERKKAKPVNFGFLYGMSANTFITTAWNNYGVEVTEEEAVAFRKAFFEAYPKLLDWHKKQRRLGHKYGRVESPLGRIRHLPDIHSADREVRGNAERQAINSPVQSFASDMAIIALITLTREFRKRGLRARSVGTVHDAINFEVPVEELPIVMPLIKQHMENPPVYEWFGVNLDVPIIGDVALSRMWGDKEEVEGDIIQSPKKLKAWLAERDLLAA